MRTLVLIGKSGPAFRTKDSYTWQGKTVPLVKGASLFVVGGRYPMEYDARFMRANAIDLLIDELAWEVDSENLDTLTMMDVLQHVAGFGSDPRD